MAIAIELPELGESVVEGTVSKWLVKEGDFVAQDQPLVEVTTDKVDVEVPAPSAGVVVSLLVSEGETVAVGGALLELEPGERSPGERPAVVSDDEAQGAPAQPVAARPVVAAPDAEAPRATPLARRTAEADGIDLASLRGSGVSGRIRRDDVERAARRAASAPAAPAAATPWVGPSALPAYFHYQPEPGDRVIPMSPLRKIVAEHMVLSKQVSPHVGTVAEIDMSAVVRLRNREKVAFRARHGYNLTFFPFLVAAAARALAEYPRLNASVIGDALVEKQRCHISIAVETEKGLIVPVVRDADRLSLAGTAAAIEDLSRRARTKRLSPDDLQGGTFTVSNPGRYGNLYGFAIINQPQVGILRMGEIAKRAVVREIDGEDCIAIRPTMHLALSYDHRAVDGAPANAFLHRVRELLEEAHFDL